MSVTISGCFTSKKMSAESVSVVRDLNISRYTGTWYEITCLPHSFENNLDLVTAAYTKARIQFINVFNTISPATNLSPLTYPVSP